MKTLFRTRNKTVLSLSAILVTISLICFYGALAKAPLGGAQKASSTGVARDTARPSYLESEGDPERDERRREYFEWLFLTGRWSLPPDAYAAVEAARALPRISRISQLEGRAESPSVPDVPNLHWRATVPPPIINSYGGNGSARISALGLDPTNPNVVYTGGPGGLAKTADGGQTWQYLSDDWASQSANTISVDPNAPDHVYVGTGSSYAPYSVGLYRSFDGGVNWTHLSAPFAGTAIRKVIVDPNASGTTGKTTLYLANGLSSTLAGLWVSENSGQDWTQLIVSSSNGIWDLAIDPTTTPSTIYFADSNGVFKGTTESDFYSIYWGNPNWNNGGVRLSLVNSAPYLLAPNSEPWPDTRNKLYTSPNADEKWTEIPTLYQGNSISPGVYAVDPADPDIILIGTNTLFRTADRGAHWDLIGEISGIHPDQTSLAFSPGSRGVVYSGNDGGMSRSTQHGEAQTWENLNQNFSGALLYRVALSRDGSMTAGTQDHGAVYSYQGAQWDMAMSGGGDSGSVLIDPTNSDIAYWTTFYHESFQRYQHSTHTNFNIHPPQFGVPPNAEPCNFFPTFSMNPSHPTRLVAACQHVVRTENGAATSVEWESIGRYPFVTGGNVVTAACEAPSDSNVIYAVEGVWQWGWRVWITTDANNGADAHWEPIFSPGGIRNVVVHPTDSRIAYLACDNGVYRREATTGNWLFYERPNFVFRDLVIDPTYPNIIFAASNMGVFVSNDGAQSFNNLGVDLPEGLPIFSLSFNPVTRQLAAATHGRGVYFLNLDNIPPTVEITSPEDGAKISGTVFVSATATDNHRIEGVQFQLDGGNLSGEDTTVPYSVKCDTAFQSGSHTLTAVARDEAGNTVTSTEITVEVIEPW